MKKTCLYILSMTFPLLACAQKGAIQGTGDIVKQEIKLEAINGVALGFSGDIILTQGSTQKIVLEGQQNVIDNIKREVRDGVWEVNYEKDVRDAKPVKVHITLATLKEASVSGSGHITSTNAFSNLGDLEVALSGSGGVNLSIGAEDVETAVSGSGSITLKGKANSIEVAISGSGGVSASELQTSNCEVAISGSGGATLYCNTNLEAAISGSGDVRYKGNAKVESHVSGSGDVEKID